MGSATSTLTSGSCFEGRYQVQGELGSGSLSHVYRARQLSTGQSVALKLLSPREGSESSTASESERFRRETRICASLSHTNIVRLIDSGETAEGQLYAVFEHIPGETLGEAIAREGRLSVRESLRLMNQVLDALSAAHAQGIVHRDLKPANILLSGTGVRRNALVLDFGLGGLAEGRRGAEWQTLTQSGAFVGTPLYAAPEQLRGAAATERSDLYAWGVVLLECLTGHHPFEGEGGATRLLSGGGAVEIPEWLRGHRLGRLLEVVTAREAADRDVSEETLIEALDEIMSSELPAAPEEAPTPAPLGRAGERRHLTVMFCDLCGSTALSQRLGPEAYREIVRAYQNRVAEAVEEYEGHVRQLLGDGVLVYFGYPQAHEDDAERAVRAGLQVLHAIEMLCARTQAEHGVPVQARVGIHTGLVVMGEMGTGQRQEIFALGDTPNIAARIEALADPGTVWASDATLRLVTGVFVTDDRGVRELKGVAEPIRLHEILQPSGVRGRLERATELTPFVGREQELGLLLDRFEQAQEGRGQAVLVSGEAGIGKSRLVRELRETLREQPHVWLECQTSPYTRSSPLHPLIGMLERTLGFRDEDSPEDRLARLERDLARSGTHPEATVPLFAGLLSLRLPERYAPLEISPQLQRQKTLEALLSWVLVLGEKQPVVLVVEDLHWIDPSTLEWLGLLIEQCPTAPVLLLLTSRPEFEPPWPARGHVSPVALSRLGRRQTKELVVAATGEDALPDPVLDRLAARSDGVPLFVEELAKDFLEAGQLSGSLSDLEIPETLQDSLMARLDRLGDARQVAQVGAAIGREFDYELLRAVAPLTEADLRDGLARLVTAELVYQRGLPPAATFTFKHALVQDAAYQSLLEGQRTELHARLADAFESRFPERVAREPETLAHHCEEAGRTAEAIAHYQRAGERATQHFAHAEAIGHLRKALELLGTLPEGAERDRQELKLQVALGPSLTATRGYGDPELGEAHERARVLAREIGEGPELVRALIGLSLHRFIRGDAPAGADLARQALEVAEHVGESFPLLLAHTRLGINLAIMGERAPALEHLEQAMRLHDPSRHRLLEASWGQGIGVSIARGVAAHVLWQLGHPDRARRLREEQIELARAGDPFDLAQALSGTDPLLLRERDRAREYAEEAIALAREHGFAFILVQARLHGGWARGDARGIEEAEESLAQLAPARVFLPWWLRIVADANRQLGRTEQALAQVEAALDIEEETGERAVRSELYRLKGELLLRQRGAADAEPCFRRALDVAREQGARSLELRAATSLARMLRDQGRRDEARSLLQPVYDWFTEGFDTLDLKDAKALLQELE